MIVAQPLESVAPSAPSSQVGADLLGWSALPLFGHAGRAEGPWMFVTERDAAWTLNAPLVDAQFVGSRADFTGAWPKVTADVAGVVIDGEQLSSGASDDRLQRVLNEAAKVCGGQGTVIVVCGHRFVPRRLSAWREYGRPSLERWQRAAHHCGLDAHFAAFARFDGSRLTDLVPADDADASSDAAATADRVVLRIGATPERRTTVLDSIADAVGGPKGTRFRIVRVGVRKIGKTAVFLRGADGAAVILRIARSPIAQQRAARNFGTLTWLHESSLSDRIKQLAPRPVAHGSLGGYPYFVETCVGGSAGPPRGQHSKSGASWEGEAAEYLVTLHRETLRRVSFDDADFERLVARPLAIIRRACSSPNSERVLRRVEDVTRESLVGRVLPLVRNHGDFTASNCLFDDDGHLTAVVDWEVSVEDGLPLLDLLQLMPIAHETSSAPRWQRFDTWMELWREPARAAADAGLRNYMQALQLPAESLRGLVLAHWATHIAERVEARRDDQRWMRQRVWQPLESIERIVV